MVNRFHSLLQDERAALSAFVTLLEAEQAALLDGDTDKLLAAVEEKNRTTAKLNEVAEQRRQALPADAAKADLDRWLKQHDPASTTLWQDIRRFAAQAQRLNQTNGELIQIKLRYNQQALGILFGAAENAGGLYGRDGQANILPSSGRTLGSV